MKVKKDSVVPKKMAKLIFYATRLLYVHVPYYRTSTSLVGQLYHRPRVSPIELASKQKERCVVRERGAGEADREREREELPKNGAF